MILTQVPERPWQKVASDLFTFDQKTFILLADYYSKFVEFTELETDSTAITVIKFVKEQFSRHGIPEQLISDNGPQYNCKEFHQFSKNYGFVHITSPPEYPQSNGFAESQVKILKNILRKCRSAKSDPYLAVLEWRNTPITNLGSPAQIYQGRRP